MALMLEMLDVHDGDKILEIHTGTGYNTALLCHRVDPAQVTSIDVDPGLISDACQRLAMLDYAPHMAVRDGTVRPAVAPMHHLIE
jgi:protein-L-isoaspartate O-methyltransferase